MNLTALSVFAGATILLLALAGCKPDASTRTAPPATGDAIAPLSPDGPDQQAADHTVAGHDHGTGPHDGTMADWGGGKYHVEFVVDHDQKEATVYILGADEKTPSPIQAEEIQLSIREPAAQVTLKAAPLDTDPAGSASRFIGSDESLGVVREYSGTITGVIDGTPYSGDFSEQPHGVHE